MNFDDTPEELAYRTKVRAWLGGQTRLRTSALPQKLTSAERLAQARDWQKKRAEAGFACITWPTEWGGPGGTSMQQVIFSQEEARYETPPTREFFEIGLGFCMPTVLKFAPPEEAKRFVRPAMYGEQIWCQLFSEPAAGSDLAGLRMRAVRDGEGEGAAWVLDGQKVWTSGAHVSDFGLVLVRTDPTVAKHKGLTMFWVDMRAPGIEVRPIHQMSGERHFNEVYFTGVRVPDSQRLGAVGEGWKVSLVTLMNERVSGGGLAGPNIREVLALAAELPGAAGGALTDDPLFAAKLADWYVQSEGLVLTRFRTLTALSRGQTPGPESSIGKLVAASELLDIAHEMMEAQGDFGLLGSPESALAQGIFQHSWLHSPGMRIAGGTDEILRTIIAERVLGLPGDIRADKDVPFLDIPSGA